MTLLHEQNIEWVINFSILKKKKNALARRMHTNEESDLIVKQAPAVSSCYHFRTDVLILLLPISDNQQPDI